MSEIIRKFKQEVNTNIFAGLFIEPAENVILFVYANEKINFDLFTSDFCPPLKKKSKKKTHEENIISFLMYWSLLDVLKVCLKKFGI